MTLQGRPRRGHSRETGYTREDPKGRALMGVWRLPHARAKRADRSGSGGWVVVPGGPWGKVERQGDPGGRWSAACFARVQEAKLQGTQAEQHFCQKRLKSCER